uniref:Uncharacterized protein n=1 Tax=Apteryx owenii TaxID=8824 RepID=A0A8B9SCE4_APTOW
MAYDDSRKKEELLESDRSVDDVGLASGRTQRERKHSYKDLLQEEEEIAAQVRKLSEKRLKDSKLVFLGTEPHKKKRKHSSDEFSYRGKMVIRQGKGLTGHDFEERELINQCHQVLWSALSGEKVHQSVLGQLIRNLIRILHQTAKDKD